MIRLLLFALTAAVSLTPGPELVQEVSADERAIHAVLERSYVEGVFRQRDPDLVRAGFAPTFVMQVYWDGKLSNRPLERWLAKMKLDRIPNKKPIEAKIAVLEVTGVAAVARVDIHEGPTHKFTDYFGLYDTADGWKIVSKLFHAHR